MKVLHVFKDYFPPTHGGVEHLMHDITHRLPGFEFVVLTSARSPRTIEEDDEGVHVVRAAEHGRIGSAPIAGFARHMRRLQPDLIHFHIPNPTGELAYLAGRFHVPAVASYHAEVARARVLVPPYHRVLGRFLRRMHTVLVGSQPFAEHTPVLAAFRDRIAIVPYAVEPKEWTGRPAAADAIRAMYPGPLVVFVGRLVHYKGLHHLIDAMRNVDATLLIVGEGGKGTGLRATAEQMGLGDRVVFCGSARNDDRAAYFHAADVCVLPSTGRSESFGIVLLEAMACGTPVVSTEIGSGTSWVNTHESTGLVVPPADPAALAKAITTILSDADVRARMGESARRRVDECFTMTHMLDRIAKIYRDAIAGGTA